jgi:hypothetical protein
MTNVLFPAFIEDFYNLLDGSGGEDPFKVEVI